LIRSVHIGILQTADCHNKQAFLVCGNWLGQGGLSLWDFAWPPLVWLPRAAGGTQVHRANQSSPLLIRLT